MTPKRAKTQDLASITPTTIKNKWKKIAGGLRIVSANIGHTRHLVSSRNKLWTRRVSPRWNRRTRKSLSKVGIRRRDDVCLAMFWHPHSESAIVCQSSSFNYFKQLLKSSWSNAVCVLFSVWLLAGETDFFCAPSHGYTRSSRTCWLTNETYVLNLAQPRSNKESPRSLYVILYDKWIRVKGKLCRHAVVYRKLNS